MTAAGLAKLAHEAPAAGRGFLGPATTFLPPSCVPLCVSADVTKPFQLTDTAGNSFLFLLYVCFLSNCWNSSVTGQRSANWGVRLQQWIHRVPLDCSLCPSCNSHSQSLFLSFSVSFLFMLLFRQSGQNCMQYSRCGFPASLSCFYLLPFSYCFQTLCGFLFTSWPAIFKGLWTKGLRRLPWVELLFYQWIHIGRVAFHGCISLHVHTLNFTSHLSTCHVKSAIKQYNCANLTASCYQNKWSHSSFPLCFYPILDAQLSSPPLNSCIVLSLMWYLSKSVQLSRPTEKYFFF